MKKALEVKKVVQKENATKKRVAQIDEKKVDKPNLIKLISDINKKFGINAVTLGSNIVPIDSGVPTRIATGNIALDIYLGGGVPIGKYTQVEGAFSATKTTQCLHILKNAQKMGLVCSMFDAEGTTDAPYLCKVGVNVGELIYCRPDSLEEATQMILDYQKSGEIHLALIDCLAVLHPNRLLDSDMDETVQMGIKQKLLDEFFGKYMLNNNKLVREGKLPFTLIATNQLREKIGSYGDPEYAPGGRAKDFASCVTIRLRKGDSLTVGSGDNKEVVGQVIKFKIPKNKTYKPMQTGEFDFYLTENPANVQPYHNDNFKSIIIEAIAWGLIERGGAWYSYNGEKFQGVDKVVEYLKDHEDLVYELKDEILVLAKETV